MFSVSKCARSRICLEPVKNAFFRDRIQARRAFSIHEHMSYAIFIKNGVPVPKHGLVTDPDQAIKVAKSLGTEDLVMKAQVLTGGRGKGRFFKSGKPGVIPFTIPQEAEELASSMIGDTLITAQSGPEGKVCNSVMIAEMIKAKHEYYLSIVMERSFHGPVIISSLKGGVDIEKVAEQTPAAINTTPIDIFNGLNKTTAEGIAAGLGLIRCQEEVGDIIMKLYEIFITSDASLVEVNPFINDESDNFYCLDAKINFDDSAEYRQKDLFLLRDYSQEDIKEVTAAKYNLNYVTLDGNIGCMVNGAGLAMATMDIIKLSGGEPANFLDVGGSATEKTVKEAFKIISSDPKAKAILVNIFGGIMRCDIIANGIVAAVTELELKIPTVVRLHGSNHSKGKNILNKSGLKIHAADDLAEAARFAVDLSNQK
ncbi:succinate--CoA ligase [ADP-forming] subunit beta, mitochondrial-like [Cimex lectularius]|uniref:Succinate--CoA ligase [ADP-forming] subunit beta, mitochondrial n=1 Tax=Cimex lectularius TaxID=79782 RepID=A0A8I6S751_CIMLE|nr:succinate--CoA ligase [ADP-forming] subunit beta, mitochondrial-like [Cimex lectularius]